MRQLGFTYTATAQSPLSIFCQETAKFLAKNSFNNDSFYKYLMYDFHELDEAIVEGLPSTTECELNKCITIINEKGTSLVPVHEYLGDIAGDQDLIDPSKLDSIASFNPYTGETFSKADQYRLWNFSMLTIRFKQALQKRHEYYAKPGTLADGIHRLYDSLEEGGKFELGTESNAAGPAYEGLGYFNDTFWKKLSNTQQEACKNYTIEEWLFVETPSGEIIEVLYPINLRHIMYVLNFKPAEYRSYKDADNNLHPSHWKMPSDRWLTIDNVEIPETKNDALGGNNITLLNCVWNLASFLQKILKAYKTDLEDIVIPPSSPEEAKQIEQKQAVRKEILSLLHPQFDLIDCVFKNASILGTDTLLEIDPVFAKYWLNPQDITLEHIITDLKNSYRLGQEALLTAIAGIPSDLLVSRLDSIKALTFYYRETKTLPHLCKIAASHIFKLFEKELSTIDPNQLQTYLNSLTPCQSQNILEALAQGVLDIPGKWVAFLRVLNREHGREFLSFLKNKKEIDLCDLNYLSRHLNEDERDSIFPIILQAFQGKEVDTHSGYDLAQFLECLNTDQATLICRSIKSLELLRKTQLYLDSHPNGEGLASAIHQLIMDTSSSEGHHSNSQFFQPPPSPSDSHSGSEFETQLSQRGPGY